jgi:hypothetical protein
MLGGEEGVNERAKERKACAVLRCKRLNCRDVELDTFRDVFELALVVQLRVVPSQLSTYCLPVRYF